MRGRSGACPEGRCSLGLENQKGVQGRDEILHPVPYLPEHGKPGKGQETCYVIVKLCDLRQVSKFL